MELETIILTEATPTNTDSSLLRVDLGFHVSLYESEKGKIPENQKGPLKGKFLPTKHCPQAKTQSLLPVLYSKLKNSWLIEFASNIL